MSKVYVVSNNGYNFDKARELGELVFLTIGSIDVGKNFSILKEKFENILKDTTEDDYLLLVGSNLLCLLAYSIIKSINSNVKLLYWSQSTKTYVQYTL